MDCILTGTFSQVLECVDNKNKEAVAIKLSWRVQEAYKAWYWWFSARIYISSFSTYWLVLTLLHFGISSSIPCSCVQIRIWFDYRYHICIVSTVTFIWWDLRGNHARVLCELKELAEGFKMVSTGVWEAWTKLIWFLKYNVAYLLKFVLWVTYCLHVFGNTRIHLTIVTLKHFILWY